MPGPAPSSSRSASCPTAPTSAAASPATCFSTFNSKSSLAGKWENVILQAAQEWAQQTNINFAVVPDDGAPAGSGADEEGNPGFGDIRIGGYNFGSSTLALTYQPPPANNFSIAGNMTFNTGPVVQHRLDVRPVHRGDARVRPRARAWARAASAGSVMYGTYTGTKKGLASDDIAGIRQHLQQQRSAHGGRVQHRMALPMAR